MQADPTELYLRPNCPLKMSFQGHENKPSNKSTNKPTADRQTNTVANMQQLYSGLTTFCLVMDLN